MKVIKTLYGVSVEILYIIAIFAWKLCRTNLAAFQGYKALYTDTYIAAALQAITDAQKLKTFREVVAARKTARVDLIAQSTAVRQNWQYLKGYITEAFAKDKINIQLEGAGALFYKKGNSNWASVSGLISAANDFISTNVATLENNNNMPKTFQDEFKKAGDLFTDQLSIFQNADLAKKNAVSNKAKANNGIYESLMAMLKDGQLVFKNDETMRQQFTYEFLVAMNKGGVASLRGYARDAKGLPIAGVTIESTTGKYTTTTDAKGRYDITRMEAGDYTFVIIKDGYIRLQQTVTVKPSQANNFNITMTPALQMVA